MKKSTIFKFIKKARKIHRDKYNYSKSNYINCENKIIIICKKHGEFKQISSSHLRGAGCPYCANIMNGKNCRSNTEKFIKKARKIHGDKYNYKKVDYEVAIKKIIIICPKHGEFLQTPNKHLYGRGCSKCTCRISKKEKLWLNEIEKEQNVKLERNITIKINDNILFPDGFHKLTNTWYEYNGYYWHGHPDYYNSNDIHPITKTTYGELYQKTLKREKLIRSAGYNLIIKWGK